MIEEGSKVAWAGIQNDWCAPGYKGVVLAISRKDENSLKVLWAERKRGTLYTWERRKNLRLREEDDDAAGSLVAVA